MTPARDLATRVSAHLTRWGIDADDSAGRALAQLPPGTLLLAVAAMCIAVALGIPLGVLAAVKKDTWMDTSAIFTSVLGISAPSFFMGIVIAYLFGFV